MEIATKSCRWFIICSFSRWINPIYICALWLLLSLTGGGGGGVVLVHSTVVSDTNLFLHRFTVILSTRHKTRQDKPRQQNNRHELNYIPLIRGDNVFVDFSAHSTHCAHCCDLLSGVGTKKSNLTALNRGTNTRIIDSSCLVTQSTISSALVFMCQCQWPAETGPESEPRSSVLIIKICLFAGHRLGPTMTCQIEALLHFWKCN